jgi:hypothetical protein
MEYRLGFVKQELTSEDNVVGNSISDPQLSSVMEYYVGCKII